MSIIWERITLATVFALTLALTPSAWAGTITKVKGKSALADFSSSDLTPEIDGIYSIMVDGKKRGELQLTQVKGKKAKGKIVKGRGVEGATLEEGTDSLSGTRGSRGGGGALLEGSTWGALLGYGMNNQTVTVGSSSVAMTGSGFSARGFMDFPISQSLGLFSRFGMEQFSVKGSGLTTNINYLAADLIMRYYFMGISGFSPMALGGLGIYYPLSNDTTALDKNKIAATTVISIGAGFNWLLSPSMFLHFALEYNLFPPSPDVTTNFISIRSGVGFKF